MNLDQLVERGGPASAGMEVVKMWLLAGALAATSCPPPPIDDELLFCLLARQLGYAGVHTPRVHVQYRDGGMLDTLMAVSIPGTVVLASRTIRNHHGICYAIKNADMSMLDGGVRGFASPCFASSSEASALFVARSGGAKGDLTYELVAYAQSMQAVGALVHAAIGRGRDQSGGRRGEDGGGSAGVLLRAGDAQDGVDASQDDRERTCHLEGGGASLRSRRGGKGAAAGRGRVCFLLVADTVPA